MSGDRELDLCLDLPKLVLGFADVDGLVVQRGTWSTVRRNLSLVWPESPEHGPGCCDTTLPCPTTACKAGETHQCWRLVGCYSTDCASKKYKQTHGVNALLLQKERYRGQPHCWDTSLQQESTH